MKQVITRTLWMALLAASAMGQQRAAITPESGFLSPERYSNAFFGFSLSLPKEDQLFPLFNGSTRDAFRHVLYAAESHDKHYTALVIVADEIGGAVSAEPKKALLALGAKAPYVTQIGGKVFWVGDWKTDDIYRVAYATAMNGYVLQIAFFAFDKKVLKEFQHSIESMSFFEPTKAQEIAGPNSRPYSGPPPR